MCAIIGSSASGFSHHLRRGNVQASSLPALLAGVAVGTSTGVYGHKSLYEWLDGREPFTLTLHGCYIVLLLTVMLLLQRRNRSVEPLAPEAAHSPRWVILSLTGLLVGVANGFLGIGGGVLMMPVLVTVLGMPMHRAVGTTLGIVLAGVTLGAIQHALLGHVDWRIALILLVGGILGAQWGSWIANRLHARHLKRYFVWLILIVILLIGWDFWREIVLWSNGGL